MPIYPLYATSGQCAGLLREGYLYNPQGEWIGWVERDGQVFSLSGLYVGTLTRDFRVLRKRSLEAVSRRTPPPAPAERLYPPATLPLPPLMAEIGFDIVDVFDEEPERLHTQDADPDAKDIGE